MSASGSTKSLQEQLRSKDAHIIALQSSLSKALQELSWSRLKIDSLEAKLREQYVARFGPRSENLTNLQLLLLSEEPGVTLDEVSAEADRGPVGGNESMSEAEAALRQQRKERAAKKPHPGRQQLPAHLPRKETVIACSTEACQCKSCGQEMPVIGYDESEVLDFEPVKYFVQSIKREKRACRECEQRSVVAAPLPPRILPKSLVSDRILIDTIVKKYCDHLPLYRQEGILNREAGVDISRATMDGWVMHIGELAVVLRRSMRDELLRANYLQADETTVWVQTGERTGKNHEAYLWQFGRPEGEVVFEFAMGRDRGVVAKFLGQWAGKLQTDGYKAYEKVGGKGLLHFGCWSHCRRYWVDAVKVNPDDGLAQSMVLRCDGLFLADREAKKLGLTGTERAEMRQQHARPFLDEIIETVKTKMHVVLPSSKLGQAFTYTLNQWDKLKRTFDDGEIELSNNLAENSMRPWALGRKNWLHVGSAEAGPKIAAIASVVESCRRLSIPVVDYLMDVLPGLAERSLKEVSGLTPSNWAAARARS